MKNLKEAYRQKATHLIPGGSHTYSKGDDQFPANSPFAIVKGKGAHVWDVEGSKYLDWGMSLTTSLFGYAYDPINEAVIDEIANGVNFSRPSKVEIDIAEILCNQIDSAEMVKFAKNGSDVNTAAVRLSRAYTGKKGILVCKDHPFFSVDDWFIGSTPVNSGIPEYTYKDTYGFRYNDFERLEKFVKSGEHDGIACLIMQPSLFEEPKDGYLQQVRSLCDQAGIVFILDEIVSGFRQHPKGAQFVYDVKPDLSTFGKSIANGFSLAALCGKQEIMRLGGLEHDKERVFLLSTTFGAETHHLRAAQKSIELLNENGYAVTKHIHHIGEMLKNGINELSSKYDLENNIRSIGHVCRPGLVTLSNEGKMDALLRTVILQELLKRNILVSNIAPSFSHTEQDVVYTLGALDEIFRFIRLYLKQSTLSEVLETDVVKPVFRKYN